MNYAALVVIILLLTRCADGMESNNGVCDLPQEDIRLFNEILKTDNIEQTKQFMQRHGMTANTKLTQYEHTPLMIAANKGAPTIIAWLLTEQEVMIDETDYSGDTALTWALQENQTECAKILIAHNANVNHVAENRSLIFEAVYHQVPEVLKLLLQSGAEFDERAYNFATGNGDEIAVFKDDEMKNQIVNILNQYKKPPTK